MSDETPEQFLAREEAVTRAFLEPQEITSGDLALRAISVTSIFQLRHTRNEFLVPRGPVKTIPHPGTGKPVETATMQDEFLALLGFAYIHGAPESEVDACVFNEALFQKRVQAFGRKIPPDRFPYLIEEITRRFSDIKKLEFGIQKKPDPGGKPGPTPPPN